MIWVGVEQRFDDGALGHLVALADVIAVLFAPYGELVEVERGAIDDRPGFASGFHRRIEHGMHDVWLGIQRTSRLFYLMTTADPQLLANIRIVLTRTSHPGNIGAAARAMKTMGLSRLVLVDPAVFPNSQADAMASGAADLLTQARVCATLAEALADTTLALGVSARRRDIVSEVLTPPEASIRLLSVAQTGPVALVFGNETSGLSNEELSLPRTGH